MAGINHRFVDTWADLPDATQVRPSNWNDGHDIVYVKETPAGTIDGANQVFTLTQTPLTDTLEFLLNGMGQTEGDDYTLSTNEITMINAPISGDSLRAKYL